MNAPAAPHGATSIAKKAPRLSRVGSTRLCTPGMGVSLWGESPLYENRKVFITMDTNKSTSRRQGPESFRERNGLKPTVGALSRSPMAKVRDDGQKPHTRLSLW